MESVKIEWEKNMEQVYRNWHNKVRELAQKEIVIYNDYGYPQTIYTDEFARLIKSTDTIEEASDYIHALAMVFAEKHESEIDCNYTNTID